MPQKFFVREWSAAIQENEQEQAIHVLAHNFKCGATVIARKAYDNGFIEYDLYQKIAKLAVQLYNEKRRRLKERGESGGDYYRTVASRIDRRFFRLLVGSVHEGKTLYSELSAITNTNRSTFANLIESVGGGVKSKEIFLIDANSLITPHLTFYHSTLLRAFGISLRGQ